MLVPDWLSGRRQRLTPGPELGTSRPCSRPAGTDSEGSGRAGRPLKPVHRSTRSGDTGISIFALLLCRAAQLAGQEARVPSVTRSVAAAGPVLHAGGGPAGCRGSAASQQHQQHQQPLGPCHHEPPALGRRRGPRLRDRTHLVSPRHRSLGLGTASPRALACQDTFCSTFWHGLAGQASA